MPTIKPEKCKIISVKKPRQKIVSSAIMRVSSENYDRICELADETGRGIKEVTDILVEFALGRVEIIESEDGK